MEYVNRDTLPFHVPGHKKGVGIDEEFKNFIGENPFKIDVTVFKLVDSLHHPTGPIKKAQILTADAYGADASFFSIHGTSGAIQAMIMSVVSDGDKIIVPRNVHKSVTSGIILSGAIPIFMQPELDKKLGIAHGVSPKTVEKTLKDNPDAKALLLINPTYYGVATDIKKIAEIVHSYHIPLIVDEAHGPHLAFSRKLPMSALEAGADIIMLDNMSVEEMKEAIRIIDGRAQTECSGNVTKENIDHLTSLGVDYISSGALTHSAPVLDISLKNLHAL